MLNERKSIKIKITGRVQNVGFRFHTADKANELQITGFVKNLIDGSVYIEAEGSSPALEAFLVWCHQGPAWARVDDVLTEEQPSKDYHTFSIIR